MKTIELTDLEVEILSRLLEDYRNKLSSAGCNDFTLPNNVDSLELIKNAFEYGSTPEDAAGEVERLSHCTGDTLYTYDFVLLGYLKNKICG